MRVTDVMTPRESLVTATVPGNRGDVLERLQDHEFSSVPVVKETEEGEQFRGLVSRERLIAEPDEDQLALLVEAVETISPDATLAEVAALVRETGQRRVPVVEATGGTGDDASRGGEGSGAGELAGIVTVTDLVRAMANGHSDGDRAVGSLAERSVNAVYRGTPLTVAEREIAYADEAYGVVLDDDGQPTGMLTEVDIIDVARVVEGEESTGDAIADQDDDWKWEGIKAVGSRYLPTRNVELPSGAVEEFMTSGLVTVSERTTTREAAQRMISEDIEQVPLMSGDELVGVVRDVDLLEAFLEDE